MAKKKKVKKKRAVKKSTPKKSVQTCSGSKSDWAHTVLAALIVVFAFVDAGWAKGVVVVAAALIFLSGVMSCCRK